MRGDSCFFVHVILAGLHARRGDNPDDHDDDGDDSVGKGFEPGWG